MKLELNTYTQIEEAAESFAFLKVVNINDYGAFLATGTPKDILLPFAETPEEVQVGDDVLAYIYRDNTDRLCASMKFEKFLRKNKVDVTENQEVNVIIYDETDLGYKAVVNRKFLGLLYKNEVFEKFYYSDMRTGFVKKVREDGKIDLILRAPGHLATDDIALKLIEELKANNSYLNITDKTSPEIIYQKFHASKKKFKIALGRLYKERVITVKDDGIYLNTENEK